MNCLNCSIPGLKNFTKFFFIFIVLFSYQSFSPIPVYPVGDQTSTGRFITENRYFFNFANIIVTNFGSDKDIELFKKVGVHDFWAQIAYLQSKYNRAFREIRKSQKIQVSLFRNMIDRYLIDTKIMLDRIAPMIIRSKDTRARHYLSLGYRDITESKSQQVVGLHSTRKLFSYKIRRYIEAINLSRRGKRYAILAIIEARTPREKKKGIENLAYEEIGAKILSLQKMNDPDVLPEYQLLLHHIDNYSKYLKKKSLIDEMKKEYYVRGREANFTEEEKVQFDVKTVPVKQPKQPGKDKK